MIRYGVAARPSDTGPRPPRFGARSPGRPPSPAVAARRSLAAEIVRRQPTIQPAALAVDLGISPSLAQLDLAHLRRAGIGQPPVAVAADGRRLTRPITGESPRWRIPTAVVDRLRAAAGVEDVGEAIGVVLDRLDRERGP